MALSNLDPQDVKLLRLFVHVVDAGGFTSAQAALNVSASTISTQMAALETRLGMRLCDRGRVGFRLTEKGRRVYSAALKLEDAFNGFRGEIGGLRNKLVGELHIGISDSLVTNAQFRIHDTINALMSRDNSIHIALHVDEPAVIAKRLIEGDLSIGISAFHHHLPSLEYRFVFSEAQGLYCSALHPLANGEPALEEIFNARYVMRGYRERRIAPFSRLNLAATAFNMEAVLMLIRSGRYIGHLPTHFADSWVVGGDLTPLAPKLFSFASEFEIAIRKGTGELQVMRAFLNEFWAVHGVQTPLPA